MAGGNKIIISNSNEFEWFKIRQRSLSLIAYKMLYKWSGS